MTEAPFRFPEYGHAGDQIGSRRARRAFRLCVAACILLTGFLWLSEYFLQRDQSERLYVSALTLEDPSARALLRQAVRLDAEAGSTPTARYLEALAVREEDDLMLPAFRRAMEFDPENARLAMRYGARLAAEARYTEAFARFRDAAAQDQDNALPGYLQAAVRPWVSDATAGSGPETATGQQLRESLALVARTNGSGNRVSVPRPLWSPDLPAGGTEYARLRRRLVRQLMLPLNDYMQFVREQARADFAAGRTPYWDSWLEKLTFMGNRLALGSLPAELDARPLPGSSLQARAGIALERDAVELRMELQSAAGGAPDEATVQRERTLAAALDELQAFDATRGAAIARDRARHVLPLRTAARVGVVLFGLYVVAYSLARALRVPRVTWTLAHTPAGKAFLIAGAAAHTVLLMSVLSMNPATPGGAAALVALPWVWAGVTGILVAFGLAYPALALPAPAKVCANHGYQKTPEDMLRAARRQRRQAWFAYFNRYFGATFALFLVSMCTWVVAHRLATGLYPWQLDLLTTGFAQPEAELVRDILHRLYAG